MLLEDPEMVLGEHNKVLLLKGTSLARSERAGGKISLEDEYSNLDNREREFCLSKGISCRDFYQVKHKIFLEQAKNVAIA
jgi:hypothetical protein